MRDDPDTTAVPGCFAATCFSDRGSSMPEGHWALVSLLRPPGVPQVSVVGKAGRLLRPISVGLLGTFSASCRLLN